MAPGHYHFGIEIEIIADPHKLRNPLVAHEYYERLVASLKKRGLKARADTSTGRYGKHPENYEKRWWITRDGSLHSLSYPEIAFEAVSPILSTRGDWEWTVDTFWEAEKAVFHMPKREQKCGTHIHITPGSKGKWTLAQLKDIAVGIIVYEAEVVQLLPSWRRDNAYCKRNTTSSSKLASLPGGASAMRRELSSRLTRITDRTQLCDFMQASRYVLWNFFNVRESSKSGTIEFRGGRGLRGPHRSKRWIAFVVAFIDFVLHERLDSLSHDPSATSVEDLYSRMREAADRHAMQQYLPSNYRVLNESARAEDDEGEGFEPFEIVPVLFFEKDTGLPPYTTYPLAAVTRGWTPKPVDPAPVPASRSFFNRGGGIEERSSTPRIEAISGSRIVRGLRVVEFLWTVLTGAISGGIVGVYGSESIINYCIFLAIFAVILLIPLTIMGVRGHSNTTLLAFETLNLLFWTCGAIGLTVQVNDVSGWAVTGPVKRLVEAQAVCGFLWLGVLCFGASMGFSTKQFLESRND